MTAKNTVAQLDSFEYDGKTYALKMTRAGVRMAESAGLTTGDMEQKPFMAVTYLFFASLYSEHKINPNKAAEMLDDLLDAGTVELADLYLQLLEAYNELFGSGGSKK